MMLTKAVTTVRMGVMMAVMMVKMVMRRLDGEPGMSGFTQSSQKYSLFFQSTNYSDNNNLSVIQQQFGFIENMSTN